MTSFFVKALVIYFLLVVILPIAIFYILHKGKKELQAITNLERKHHSQLINSNVNLNSNYFKVKNTFNSFMKKGMLNRDSILDFKKYINTNLEKNLKHYEKFYFKNDCQEIYTKLKNSSLNEANYIQMYDYLIKVQKSQKNKKES